MLARYLKYSLTLIILINLTFVPPAKAATYYVSTSGSDSNNGAQNTPYLTLKKGISSLKNAGDTLLIRGGVYSLGRLDISGLTGTESSPITIAGNPGERPIIDADGKIASLWDLFVFISNSNYLTLQNLELKNSRARGIYIGSGSHITFRDIWVHDTALAAVWADNISYVTIENSRFWMNNLVNYSAGPWYESGMWMGSLHLRGPDNTTFPHATDIAIRGNEISQGFGECINLHGRVSGAVVENNVIHDCWAPAIYFPNDQNITIQNNKLYHTNDARFLRNGNPSAGIGAMAEGSPTRPGEMKNIQILNNYVEGFNNNFFFWPNMGAHLENVTVKNNTFVNAHSNTGSGNNISIGAGPHVNASFSDNTIYQSDKTASLGSSDGSFVFSNNHWSSQPPANMRSATDTVVTSLASSTPLPSATPITTYPVGDADHDQHVTILDYDNYFIQNYLKTVIVGTDGDFSLDGLVDGVDYVLWMNNYEI